MLEVGKFAFDTANSANIQILEGIEARGYISYQVFNNTVFQDCNRYYQ